MRRIIHRVGIPGILAAGLGLFCLSFYAGSVGPAGDELAALDRDLARLGSQTVALPPHKTRAEQPIAVLSSASEMPALIQRLGEIGEKTGFAIDRAAFRQIDEGKLQRLEVELPLKGSYPAIRGFLRDIAALSSAVTIDELTMRRGGRADTAVDAQVRLSYYFTAP